MSGHTVRSYEEELRRIASMIGEMGACAGEQLEGAVEATHRRDPTLARRVVSDDVRLDELDRRVSEAAVKLLALRAPVANDLREAIAAIRISSDLERVGDLAKNLARRSQVLARFPQVSSTNGIARIGLAVRGQLDAVLRAYRERDAEAARAVWLRDEEVDDLFHSLFREYLTYMMEDPRTLGAFIHLLFMAKNAERIGDHCANVAATVYYLATGKLLQEPRPKGEDTATTLVAPPSD